MYLRSSTDWLMKATPAHADRKVKQTNKTDLEDFMQQNFRLNINVKEMASLTGRSLASFKRDFNRTFHQSPRRWVQQRRLEEAFYLIKESGKRPSEVYNEVGFETFAHFSFAFKQYFGLSPSNV